MEPIVCKKTEYALSEFLMMQGFEVKILEDTIYRIEREGELPVFLNVTDERVYFEVDLGNVSEIASEDLYFQLLDMNTEVLPVSFAINNANPEDPRLVLMESRETASLEDNELLSVLDALELAAEKAEVLLQNKLG